MRAAGSSLPLGPLPCLVLCPCSDQHDIMACCKGDYGLYYRSMAGWLRGGAAERAVLAAADLAAPSTRRLSIWPLDRWGASAGAKATVWRDYAGCVPLTQRCLTSFSLSVPLLVQV